jgi:FkbM family methyltransferase
MNCRWNSIDKRVLRVNVALGANNEIAHLRYPEDNNFGDIRISASGDYPGLSTVSVVMRALDSFEFGVDASKDLIWMDVQGRELGVLAGASTVMKTGVPIVMEFWPFELRKFGSAQQLITLLRGYGFFVDLATPESGRRPLSELFRLWAAHEQSEASFTDILVVPEG